MEHAVKLFKVLSDETRLRIIKLLQHKNCLCVCEIMQALDITQTRASRNLGILKDAGLVIGKRSGPWVEHSFDKRRMDGQALAVLKLISGWLEDSDIVREDRRRLARASRVGPEAVAESR